MERDDGQRKRYTKYPNTGGGGMRTSGGGGRRRNTSKDSRGGDYHNKNKKKDLTPTPTLKIFGAKNVGIDTPPQIKIMAPNLQPTPHVTSPYSNPASPSHLPEQSSPHPSPSPSPSEFGFLGGKLLNEHLAFCKDNVLKFMSDQTEFTVIGILGPQGAGKSTILSEVYGYSVSTSEHLPFPVQSKQTTISSKHETTGIIFEYHQLSVLFFLTHSHCYPHQCFMKCISRIRKFYLLNFQLMKIILKLYPYKFQSFYFRFVI
eukprot:TRINITY_DN4554_c0_g1_i1.p1 TRINITY_DN4554_c0_g1~~TRINITY_DN4554_c0_g1_i1.p1  ORF type:complete len:260 (+),score=39.08 TRINITY_DN4554_c0_g1_i1:72-851(+)